MASPTAYRKPLPTIDVWNKPFWDACREHRFIAQKDNRSGHVWFPPGPVCPTNRSSDWRWVDLSGRGTVWSWVVFHQKYYDGFESEMPYNVATVELDEGPRIMTNIVNTTNDKLRVGMRVGVTFRDVDDRIAIPLFQPIAEGGT